MSLIDHASYRAEMTDTETRSLTEMEVGTGGGPAVIDFLHLLSPHLSQAHSDSVTHLGFSVKSHHLSALFI